MKKTKTIAIVALGIALAFIMSYVESLIPFNIGIPGIKLGLANLIVITSLYLLDAKYAFLISVVRIILSGLTFGGMFSIVYSLAGGLLSFLFMILAKKIDKFSIVGVSILGAVMHNLGQIIVAAIVTNTSRIYFYFPVLIITGIITGLIVGVLATVIINRLNKIINKNGFSNN